MLANAVLLLILVGLAVSHQGVTSVRRQPVAYRAQFSDEFGLIGYHVEPSHLHPGDALAIRLYWLVERTPKSDYKVFIHLSRVDDSGTVAQVDEPPVFGLSFTTRWDPGEIIVDEHELLIDSTIAPGIYRVLVGMYHPDPIRNLPVVSSSEIWPGDRVVLTSIEIRDR